MVPSSARGEGDQCVFVSFVFGQGPHQQKEAHINGGGFEFVHVGWLTQETCKILWLHRSVPALRLFNPFFVNSDMPLTRSRPIKPGLVGGFLARPGLAFWRLLSQEIISGLRATSRDVCLVVSRCGYLVYFRCTSSRIAFLTHLRIYK